MRSFGAAVTFVFMTVAEVFRIIIATFLRILLRNTPTVAVSNPVGTS